MSLIADVTTTVLAALCSVARVRAMWDHEPASPATVCLSSGGETSALLLSLPVLAVQIDGQGMLLGMSLVCEEVTGLSARDFVGGHARDFFTALGAHVDMDILVRQALRSGIAGRIRTRTSDAASRQLVVQWQVGRLVDSDGRGRSVVAVGQDITRHVLLEERTEHTERLRAVGQTVAGVVHELSNPLTAVLGSAELLAQHVPTGPGRRHIDSLQSQARRAQRLIGALLRFVRGEEPEMQRVRLCDVVLDAVSFVGHQLRSEGIAVSVDVDELALDVWATPAELHQVLLNLLINAQQALVGGGGSEVTVAGKIVGNMAQITVTDDGPGVPPELLAVIFEPFTTTKRQEEGTGLGLSISRGIVERHGGSISAENLHCRGARFTVCLPLLPGSRTASCQPREMALGDEPRPSESMPARLLVVDDEPSLRLVLGDALRAAGHVVVDAKDGNEALEKLRAAEYDLVLCDLSLAGAAGGHMYREFLAARPGLAGRVVFITGDMPGAALRDWAASAQLPCVEKPFSMRHIVETVAAHLAQGPAR